MSLIGNYVKNVKMDFDALEFDETSALESTHEKYRSRFLSILDKKRVLPKVTGEGVSFPMEQCDVSFGKR